NKRVAKTFERYNKEAKKYEAEIYRRLEGDKITFKDVLSIENLIVLKNDYTKESFINNLKEVVNLVFLINNRNESGVNFTTLLGGTQ
ncbi:MAG: hypothetical protein ACRCX2_35650, partial [Paraclostridium sp.]